MQVSEDKIRSTSTYPLVDRWYKTDWLKRLELHAQESVTAKTRYKEILLLIPFMVLVFALTTPFNFSWSKEVKNRENVFGVNEAVARMQHGNMGRRAGLLILGIYGVVALGKTRHRLRINTPEGILAITYMGWVLASLTWSIDTMFTLRRVTTFYILGFAALATAQRYSIREIALLAVGVCGITALLALGNELRLNTMEPSSPTWRFSGIFHTVAMGWNCGLLAISAAYLASVTKTRRAKWFMYGTLVGAIVLLLLTKGRMPLASMLMGLFFFWMMASSRKNKAAIVLGIISLSCLLYLLIGNQVINYLDSAGTLGRGEEVWKTVSTLTGRIPLWEECFKWADKRPLLGYGFNTFISPTYYAQIAQNVGWNPGSTHSAYVDTILGVGYIGFFMLASLLIVTTLRAVMLARRFLSYNFLAAVLIWLCYNIFLESNLISRPFFMTFFVLTVLAHFAFLPEEQASAT